jgi:hypothetical protein
VVVRAPRADDVACVCAREPEPLEFRMIASATPTATSASTPATASLRGEEL